MKTTDFILTCLGVGTVNDYLDDIQEDFGVEISEQDVRYAAMQNTGNMGNILAEILFEKVAWKIADRHPGFDKQRVSWYINGSLDTHLYLDRQKVSSWNKIDEMLLEPEEE